MTRSGRSALALSFALLLAAPHARSQGNLELGKMWTFENPPLAYLEEEYGFKPTSAWLDALRLASLRFGNGCSASFVSPKGLILTNHHCARDDIARVSPKDADWVTNGFYATGLADEVELPGLTVQQLVAMENVTEAMNAGISDGDDDAAASQKRAANEKAIVERARTSHPGLSPKIVSLHQGAVFQLYLYKVYSDIRLVCSPHLQTAHFGGDPDNFTYPRYCLDFTFCRAYEDGKPADTRENYFRWSRGAMENELVFVTGNPGSTDRLKTMAELVFLRDAYYPIVRELIDNHLAIMRELAKESPEQEQDLRTSVLMFENAQKAYTGYHEGLLDPRLMERKAKAEADFKARVQSDPENAARYGKVWQELEDLAVLRTGFEARRRFQTPGGSKHLARALAVVLAVRSSGDERDRRTREVLEMPVRMSTVERAFFVDHLTRAQNWLRPNDPYLVAILGKRTPDQTADLLDASAIGDQELVHKLLDGGERALAAEQDPAIRMALALAPLVRANEKMSRWLEEQQGSLGVAIGRALFAAYGNTVSPDATSTLRFSDGRVKGFPYNGTVAPYRTSFYGLYARNVEFRGREPFDLPQIWLERTERIDLEKPVDFVSTNDIIGGNSGSPIVNKDLEVVGLIFDGNIEMLPNKFLYTDAVARAVSVHVQGIMEALTKVYEATRVVEELTAGPKTEAR
jgi:hypothetical protein